MVQVGRTACILLAASVALTAMPAAAASDISFAPPGEYAGAVQAGGATWLAVYFVGADQRLDLGFAFQDATMSNRTTAEAMAQDPTTGQPTSAAYPVARPAMSIGDGEARLAFVPGPERGYLLVEAQSIMVDAAVLDGQLHANTESGVCGTHWLRHLDTEGTHMPAPRPCFHVGPVLQNLAPTGGASAFAFTAEGLSRIEWHNMDVACGVGVCPDGAHPWSVGPASAKITMRPVTRLVAEGGSVEGAGAAAGYALGGTKVDFAVDGDLRLPFAQGAGCTGCFDPQDQALVANGAITLGSLSLAPDGRLQGGMAGEFRFARLDETPIDVDALNVGLAVTTAAGVVGGVLLLKLLLPLLTKPDADRAMEHPRRRVLYEYIKAHPGATFRELARESGMHLGTARHHLGMLKRAGLIDERRHRTTLRFFENHGRFANSWREEVMLREPALRTVRDWLEANPGAFQKDVLDAMALIGWSRSTTQHRLARLVAEGIAVIHLQGRFKSYRVAPQMGPRPAVVLREPARMATPPMQPYTVTPAP